MTKGNMHEWNIHISKVSWMRYLKCFYALNSFYLSSPTTVRLLKTRKRKKIRTETKKKEKKTELRRTQFQINKQKNFLYIILL